MKNFMKSMIKALTFIFIVAFATFPFAGCSNKSANKTTEDVKLENIADKDSDTENSENVSTEESTDENEENQEESIVLNGIYKVTRKITYKDTWFEDQKATIEFFNTRDINGVYNALRMLNFEETVNSYVLKTEEAVLESMYRFNKQTVTTAVNIVGTSTYFDEGTTARVQDKFKTIEVAEDGTIYLYEQFSYVDAEKAELVNTPIYVKIPVQLVAGSENILTGNRFIYKAESAKIIIDDSNATTQTDATSKLAAIFGVKDEVADKSQAVVDILSNWKLMISNDLTKITILINEKEYTFTNLENGAYTIDNVSFSLISRFIDLETKTETAAFSIALDDTTVFVFSFIAE